MKDKYNNPIKIGSKVLIIDSCKTATVTDIHEDEDQITVEYEDKTTMKSSTGIEKNGYAVVLTAPDGIRAE